MRSKGTILLFVTLVFVSEGFAQDPPNIRGLGMARTISGLARGIGALGINPANLGMPENRLITINLVPFGMRVSSDLISYETYKDFFTGVPGPNGTRVGRYLTNEDKEQILSVFPEGVATSRAELDLMPAGLGVHVPGVGGFAVATIEHIGTKMVLPKEYLSLFLYGLDSAGSTYSFNETSVSAWWWREYNFSYGTRIPIKTRNNLELYAGIGLKYVSGYGTMETTRYKASIGNTRENQNQYRVNLFFDYLMKRSGIDFLGEKRDETSFSVFPSAAGTGFGVDLGIAARIHGIDVHLSVTDIGSVSWKENIVETFGSYNLEFTDPFFKTNEDSIQRAIRGTNRPGEAFSTGLPTRFRMGIVLGADTAQAPSWLPSDLVIGFDLSQGFNESMGNSGNPRVSLGAEYRGIPGLPLRTGITIGDDSKFRWAVGLGFDLRYFSLDLAMENVGLLFSPKNFDMFAFAMGFQIRT